MEVETVTIPKALYMKLLQYKKDLIALERRYIFVKMEPFKDIDDIPEIPLIKDKKEYEDVVVKNLIRCGAIPKDKLEVGATYIGTCRNASKGVWNGEVFEIERYKFGDILNDTVDHFQDDKGYDVFVPLRKEEK